MQGIYYNWNTNKFPELQFTNKQQIGFSAQEVEKIFPELVITDANGYKAVDYGKLSPVLVEAIKEQQKKMDEMKQEIEDLKKMVQELSKK